MCKCVVLFQKKIVCFVSSVFAHVFGVLFILTIPIFNMHDMHLKKTCMMHIYHHDIDQSKVLGCVLEEIKR